MFEVGDHIFYPMHGAGKVKAIEEKEFSGKKQTYYIIHLLIGNMKVMIPKRKMSKSTIRPVKDLDTVKKIATMFEGRASDETLTWKQRDKMNTDKLKTGKLLGMAEVVSGLVQMQEEKKLNSSDRIMLKKAQEYLMSELKLIEGMTVDKTKEFLSIITRDRLSVA